MTLAAMDWNHLPRWVQAIIVGNLVQAAFVAVLRVVLGRFSQFQPLVDRIGPKALRSSNARKWGGGLVIAICWFIISIKVGHAAIRAKQWVVARVLTR